jgi:hypothetical protein
VRWPSGAIGRWSRCTRWCSSTPFTSRSATGRSLTGPSASPSGSAAGERDILELWAGDGGEGAKFWLAVLTEIKNRGTADVCIVVCDGLKGLPEAVNTVWDRAIIQTCVVSAVWCAPQPAPARWPR